MGKLFDVLNDRSIMVKMLLSHISTLLVYGLTILILVKIFPSTPLYLVLVIGFLVSIIVGLVFDRIFKNSNVNPLLFLLQKISQAAKGDFSVGNDEQIQNLGFRQDEIGQLSKGLDELFKYLNTIEAKTTGIIRGDFPDDHQLVSKQDGFGLVFNQMIGKFKQLKFGVTSNTNHLYQVSDGLNHSFDVSYLTINQMLDRMNHTSSEKSYGAHGYQDVKNLINDIQGAVQENVFVLDGQKGSVDQGQEVSSKLAGAIEKVSGNIREVANESNAATQIVQTGVEKIGVTFKNIEGIRSLVELSQEKVTAMQSQTGKISRIVETIEDIAAQTNLLAINATIEAAHAEADSKVLTEAMLERFMYAACEMVARLLENSADIPPSYWTSLGDMAGIDQILITDDDGVIVIGNDPQLIGFRFPEDNPQTAEFRTLIHQKNGKVCQPAQMRAADKQIFKYAGVSRRDQPGIVQVGYNMNSLALFNFQIGGFAVVAREVYDLAESSRTATKEIRQLLKGIQDAANEANGVMENSVGSVKTSLSEAVKAGNSLNEIMSAIKHVSEKTNSVAGATEQMKAISAEFQNSIKDIQSGIGQNTKILDKLQHDFQSLSVFVEELAVSSDDKNRAIEAVKGSANALKTEFDSLTEKLQQIKKTVLSLNTIITESMDRQ